MDRWVDSIRIALENLGGIAHRSQIIEEVKRIRAKPHIESIIQTIQQTIQSHSSDSKSYSSGENIFYSVDGIGSGVWGLRDNLLSTPYAIDVQESEATERMLCETYRILRDTELARKLKLLHRNECQICGSTIQLPNGQKYSEAHHIKPLGRPHNGPDISQNIIVLCPNHHVMFDYGCINLEHKNIRHVQGHLIGQEFVEYHNSNVFNEATK